MDNSSQTYNYKIWNNKYACGNKIPISIGDIKKHLNFEVVLAIKM